MKAGQRGTAGGASGRGANKDLNVSSLAQQQISANSVAERDRIRTNATSLSEGEWDIVDDAVREPLRDRLVLTQRFEQAGLTQDIEWWQNEATWSVRGGMTAAEHSTSLKVQSEEDIVEVGTEGIGIPYSIKDYRIQRAELERSRRTGMPLDTTYANEAARKVAELVEATILYGAPNLQIRSMDGTVLGCPGLLNVSGRVQQPASGDWATGTNAVNDLRDAVHTLKTRGYAPGYWVLHGQDLSRDLQNDYGTQEDRSNMEKVDEIPEIDAMVEVPAMPNGEAVVVQPSPSNVDLLRIPDGPLNIQWSTHGDQEIHNKVYHLLAPRIRHQYNADLGTTVTGVVHISGA